MRGDVLCRGCRISIDADEHDESDRDCGCAACIRAVERPIRERRGLSLFGRDVLDWGDIS